MSGLSYLDAELEALAGQDLLRSTRQRGELPTGALMLCSNDYLGLSQKEVRAPGGAFGAGASALVWGYHEAHARAEHALARYIGAPGDAALMFSSGYAANVGTLAALAGRGDVIVSDALNHASIIDGCRLSRAAVEVTPHLDLDAVDQALGRAASARRRLVVTESYFGMDGDGPDLASLRGICDRHGAALMIDEAHAIGVMGPKGRGLAADQGIRPDVLVGTLGKAFGLAGAFVIGSPVLRTWLWNRARSFVFSTAVAPTLAVAVTERVRDVRKAERRRSRLEKLATVFRERLGSLGWPAQGRGPIVPILVGDAGKALRVSAALLAEGLVVQAIRPPTVPPGTSRLRVTLHAGLRKREVRFAAEAIDRALRGSLLPP